MKIILKENLKYLTVFYLFSVICCMEAKAVKGENKNLISPLMWTYNGQPLTFHVHNTIFLKVKAASIRLNRMVNFKVVDVISSKNLKCKKNQINEICISPQLLLDLKRNKIAPDSQKEVASKKKIHIEGLSSRSYYVGPYGIKKIFECDISLISDTPRFLTVEHEMAHCIGFDHAPKGLMTVDITFAKPFIYKPQLKLWFSLVVKKNQKKLRDRR